MKNQIKFPVILENYLNPSLGNQDKTLNQDKNQFLSDEAVSPFSMIQKSEDKKEIASRKRANPRLKIL